jgi:hypothetical protein
VEVDVRDYLGGAGAWDGRVGELVLVFGLGLVCWVGLMGCGRRLQGGEETRGEDVGKKED